MIPRYEWRTQICRRFWQVQGIVGWKICIVLESWWLVCFPGQYMMAHIIFHDHILFTWNCSWKVLPQRVPKLRPFWLLMFESSLFELSQFDSTDTYWFTRIVACSYLEPSSVGKKVVVATFVLYALQQFRVWRSAAALHALAHWQALSRFR